MDFDARDRTEPDTSARLRCMARAGGYVMVRYSGMVPFVLTEKRWLALPLYSVPITFAPAPDKAEVGSSILPGGTIKTTT